jgi:hypothetical protein
MRLRVLYLGIYEVVDVVRCEMQEPAGWKGARKVKPRQAETISTRQSVLVLGQTAKNKLRAGQSNLSFASETAMR